MMKRWMPWILSLAVAAGVSGCGGAGPAAPEGQPKQAAATGDPYKIGAILDITGSASALGVPERNTLQMLVQQVNDQGGIKGPDGKMHKVDLVLYDNNGQESESVLLANKLIKTDRVPVIIGTSQTGTSLAIVDAVQKGQVPLISLAASARVVTPVDQRQWVFKTSWNDDLVVAAVVADLKARNLTRIALLTVNNAYGDSARTAFEQQAPAAGLQLVLTDRFDTGVKDLTPLLNRVKAGDAQAVVVWALPPETAIAAKAHKALKLTQQLYLSHGVATGQFLQLAGEAAEGALMPGGKALVPDQIPASDPQKQAMDQFNSLYTAAHKTPISNFGGHAWDAFQLAVRALGQAGPDPVRVRDALETGITEQVGITGIYNMSRTDHTGLDKRGLVVLQVQGGAFRLVRSFSEK